MASHQGVPPLGIEGDRPRGDAIETNQSRPPAPASRCLSTLCNRVSCGQMDASQTVSPCQSCSGGTCERPGYPGSTINTVSPRGDMECWEGSLFRSFVAEMLRAAMQRLCCALFEISAPAGSLPLPGRWATRPHATLCDATFVLF